MNASSSNSPGSREFSSARENVGEAVNRGKEGMSNAAGTLAGSAANDLDSLRRDLNSLKETMTRFMSQAGDVSSSVVSQVGNAASSLAESGANVASAARDQAKTFASELESMGRRNPLGAMAAAVMVGVLIGLITRGRSEN
jgi:ElaB/YqjD/DUF883 family membrane-anchored ribosome-binding protein